MKKKLLTTTLIMGALAISGVANAATPSATQQLQCTLGAYINITPDNTAVTSATINVDSGVLSNPLTSKFNIQLNSPQTLYLRANALSKSNTNEKAFFQNGTDVYVILAHTTNKPTVAAMNNAKSGSAAADQNPNVIAYKVTGVTLGGTSSDVTPSYDEDSYQYEIAALPGLSSATTTIATSIAPNTYSYLDTAGTYQAVVTLSSSST